MRETEAVWRFAEGGAFVERECLLFEAGVYADKGVTISEEDLQAIVRNSDALIPVKIEHLAESPFDNALGVVTRLRAEGARLWGTLRQPVEAWRLLQRTGARALSVGLDVAGRRIVETSFVCRPRVANAQVFGRNASPIFDRAAEEERIGGDKIRMARFTLEDVFGGERTGLTTNSASTMILEGGAGAMSSVRQFAEGVIGYLRGAAGIEERYGVPDTSNLSSTSNTSALNTSASNTLGAMGSGVTGEAISFEAVSFAEERARLEGERAQIRRERADQQIMEWKRQGRLRGTEAVETMARLLLMDTAGSVVQFDGESVPLSGVFARFMRENGPVVPMGEWMGADRQGAFGGSAGEQLARMAQERSQRDGSSYMQALLAVTAANPELSRAAREG